MLFRSQEPRGQSIAVGRELSYPAAPDAHGRKLGGDIDGVDEDQHRDGKEGRHWHVVGGWARPVPSGCAVRLADLAKPTQMSKLQDRE